MINITCTPTPSLRAIKRGTAEDERIVIQQRVLITRNAGTSMESTTYAWLDVEHELWQAVESSAERATRESVEHAYADGRFQIIHPR